MSSSPFTSWGAPMAAASTTAGWLMRAPSTSAGPTRFPATLMVSSARPWRNQYPSSSTMAQSPWYHMPSKRDQYVSM